MKMKATFTVECEAVHGPTFRYFLEHHREQAREDPPMKWYVALTWILLAALLGFFGVLSGTITI
jgi:hypothetical protein